MIAYYLDCHSSRLRFLHNRQTIRTETLTEACRLATNELRRLRLTDRRGPWWDLWTLVAHTGPGGLPRIRATGDHTGVRWRDDVVQDQHTIDRRGEDYGWPGLTTRSRRHSGPSHSDSPPGLA